MRVEILPNKQELGRQAAEEGARALRAAINERGEAYAILATGASQMRKSSAPAEFVMMKRRSPW